MQSVVNPEHSQAWVPQNKRKQRKNSNGYEPNGDESIWIMKFQGLPETYAGPSIFVGQV